MRHGKACRGKKPTPPAARRGGPRRQGLEGCLQKHAMGPPPRGSASDDDTAAQCAGRNTKAWRTSDGRHRRGMHTGACGRRCQLCGMRATRCGAQTTRGLPSLCACRGSMASAGRRNTSPHRASHVEQPKRKNRNVHLDSKEGETGSTPKRPNHAGPRELHRVATGSALHGHRDSGLRAGRGKASHASESSGAVPCGGGRHAGWKPRNGGLCRGDDTKTGDGARDADAPAHAPRSVKVAARHVPPASRGCGAAHGNPGHVRRRAGRVGARRWAVDEQRAHVHVSVGT